MKIVIDARFWGPSHTGLGVYTRELVEHLAKLDEKYEYVLLIRKEAKPLISLPQNFSTIIAEASAYSFKEQILLPLQFHRLKPQLVHFPSINVPLFYFGKYVVTVHDLIKHDSRGTETSTHNPLFYWFKYCVYRISFRILVTRASAILVPSESVKKDLVKRYAFTERKITVTKEAPVLDVKHGANISLPPLFAIYTGNAYPHKNVARLIQAWKTVFNETRVVLLISSGRSVFSQKIEKYINDQGAQNYIKYAGYLSDEQLVTAYQRAILYVFPTLMEGFGIPGLDAMKYALPVVCSDIPVLREIYGDAAQYFDPKSTEDIAKKLIDVINNEQLRERLIKKGTDQVGQYSWEKTARETFAIYTSVIESNNS
jgi:glycosyltransferase involved in cell wall biosynthesis